MTPLSSSNPDHLTCGLRVLTVFPSPPLRDSGSDQHRCTRRAAHRGRRKRVRRAAKIPVTHTGLRGPHKSLVVHPSSEPDKSSRGRAESWTSLRRAPARRGGRLRDPPPPSSGADPTTKWHGRTAADGSGGASVRARHWHDSVTTRSARRSSNLIEERGGNAVRSPRHSVAPGLPSAQVDTR